MLETYKCDKCKDRTFVLEGDVAIPCECRAVREVENILKASDIQKSFRKKVFDNFDYSIDKTVLDGYIIAKTYAKNFDEISKDKHNSICLMGQSGAGKSHLALSIANYLMEKGIAVRYMSYRQSIIKLKQCVMDYENYTKMMERYKGAKLLVMDDLFKGNVTNSDVNIVFELLEYRYIANKPCIITTERSFDDLINIDEAIGGRIIEMCKSFNVELKGRELNYRIV